MNGITPKEAIANLNHIYGMVAPDIQRSLDVAIKALENQTTEGDLISRSELKKCAIPCQIHNGALTDLCVPLYQIDNAPTVAERPQGEWYYSIDKGWECNQCHEIVKDMPTCMRKALYNFCPNCGADMRGDENGKS